MLKRCSRCKLDKKTSEFSPSVDSSDGFRSECKECSAANQRARRKRRKTGKDEITKLRAAARQASDYEALKPADYDVGVGNVGTSDPKAGAEKRQEFTQEQGNFLDLLKASGGDPAKMPDPEAHKSAHYVALVAEQERRFQNRRLARTATIWQANEALNLRMLMQVAKDYFWDKTTPTGYATRTPIGEFERLDIVGLSDLHFGAERGPRAGDPKSYGALEESRRFAAIVQNFSDYKSKHRNHSRAVALFNGDLFDGILHMQEDHLPLEEQLAAALSYCRQAIQNWSAAYPHLDIWWEPGNHGRDPGRHPGRATSRKWQGPEWLLGYVLSQMCAALPNVKFHLPFKAVGIVPIFDKWLLLSHGDTEVPLSDPDNKAKDNAAALAKINTARVYGVEFSVGFFGHFHKGRYFPWEPMRAIFNGALIPGASQGYARSSGMTAERCGQWIWEATAHHPIGHHWFHEVGDAEDRNADLNKIIPPFRFDP